MRSTCCRRCSSVTSAAGSAWSRSMRNSSAFCSATGRKARSTSSQRSTSASGPRLSSILPASTLDRSRMSLISASRSLPAAWIVSANSTCWGCRLPSPFSASIRERISSEFSGVRSSWLMLARNSDLYFELRASWAAFSSRPARASSISAFLISMSRFCCCSTSVLSWSSSLVWRSSSDCFWSSWVSACDWVSSCSVRMLAWIVLMTTPMVSASWSRKAWLTSLKGRSAPSSMTPRTCSSNMTGMTTRCAGVASPSAEEILM